MCLLCFRSALEWTVPAIAGHKHLSARATSARYPRIVFCYIQPFATLACLSYSVITSIPTPTPGALYPAPPGGLVIRIGEMGQVLTMVRSPPGYRASTSRTPIPQHVQDVLQSQCFVVLFAVLSYLLCAQCLGALLLSSSGEVARTSGGCLAMAFDLNHQRTCYIKSREFLHSRHSSSFLDFSYSSHHLSPCPMK